MNEQIRRPIERTRKSHMKRTPNIRSTHGSEWQNLRRAPLAPVIGTLIFVAYLLLTTGAGPRPNNRQTDAPELFATSDVCLACHNGLITRSGEDVSIGANWRASMMANAARDPYWQAAVRRETIDHPPATATIESECSTCHMPMAHFTALAAQTQPQIFAYLPVQPAHLTTGRDAALASDGVGCATCHQITSAKLGTRDSFVGGFVIDSTTPAGSRTVFGPFNVDRGRTRIMLSASGFLPKEGLHIQESELCASCHTLITHALDENHEVVGELPEQVPYLEWLHSDYAGERSCQNCHMPVVKDSVEVSSVLGLARSDVNRHVFRGGNFLIPRMFTRFGTELGVQATAGELQASVSRTLDHLKTSAASVRVEELQVGETGLSAVVVVTNRAGHKLPTAYPSRRVWLHVTVIDAHGNTVFESGALNPDGSIEGNDNDAADGTYESHHQTINRPGQVQVYEAIMVDPQDRVTTGLTSGLRFIKDNRILPSGFDKETADDEIEVQGLARDDSDFVEPADRIRYEVGVDPMAGPFDVTAELWYQPVGFRWAQNLRAYDAMETQRFVKYYDELSEASAELLARDSRSNGPR